MQIPDADHVIICTICQEEVKLSGDKGRAVLQCGHHFHLECINAEFIAKRAKQCPNCRKVEKGQWCFPNTLHHSPVDNSHNHEDPAYPELITDADHVIMCTICQEEVKLSGDKGRAVLQCGHHFHLGCINPEFIAKGAMQCPNCRKVEKGQWCFPNTLQHSPVVSLHNHGDPAYPELLRFQIVEFNQDLDAPTVADSFSLWNRPYHSPQREAAAMLVLQGQFQNARFTRDTASAAFTSFNSFVSSGGSLTNQPTISSTRVLGSLRSQGNHSYPHPEPADYSTRLLDTLGSAWNHQYPYSETAVSSTRVLDSLRWNRPYSQSQSEPADYSTTLDSLGELWNLPDTIAEPAVSSSEGLYTIDSLPSDPPRHATSSTTGLPSDGDSSSNQPHGG